MKQKLMKIVNPVLFLTVVFQLVSGYVGAELHHPVLMEVHVITGWVIGGLAVVHLILNWGWVKSLFKKAK